MLPALHYSKSSKKKRQKLTFGWFKKLNYLDIGHCLKLNILVLQTKSSQVYFTISLKVRRQETAIRPCGHLGQLHLLAMLNSYRHKLKPVIEHKKLKISLTM